MDTNRHEWKGLGKNLEVAGSEAPLVGLLRKPPQAKLFRIPVEGAFGSEIDFAQLIKLYGNELGNTEARYSPPACTGTR